MLLAGRTVHDIARANFLLRLTPALRPSATGCHDQNCPSGWVCQAVRAPASKVTVAPSERAGAGGSKSGSMRTFPVKYSAGPFTEGCEPLRWISNASLLR